MPKSRGDAEISHLKITDENSLFVNIGVYYEQVSRSTSRAREPGSRQSEPVEVLWSSQLRV